MNNTRTENSKRNSLFGLLMQVIYLLCSFATRTILIKTLGATYLGVNSVFQNLLSILSIAELGFGTVILVSLFKPLADNDENKICAYLRAYKKVYIFIGLIILVLGLCFLPFINAIIGNQSGEIGIEQWKVCIFFLIYLLTTVSSYFFSYKRALIQADQKKYIDNINYSIFFVLKNVLMSASLLILSSKGDYDGAFFFYLVVQPIMVVGENVSISIIANKKYPYIKTNKSSLNKPEKKELAKLSSSLFIHKAAETVVTGTDSIIISICLGVTIAGYYSNYMLIFSVGSALCLLPMSQINASVGNMVVTCDEKANYAIFRRILFGYFILIGVITAGLFSLTQSFVKDIWLAKEVSADPDYYFPIFLFIALTVSFYIRYSREPIACYKEVTHLFSVDWGYSIAKAVINIVVSVILALVLNHFFGWQYGLLGVVLGTIVCLLTTSIWDEPYYVYKLYFHVNVREYFKDYFSYSLVNLLAIGLSALAVYFIPGSFSSLWLSVVVFIAKGLLVVLVCSVVYITFYRKNPFFSYFIHLIFDKLIKK